MAEDNKIFKVRGKVIETLPGTKFKVGINLMGNEHQVMAYISGKMRMHYIKLQVGDEVELEISAYDLNKGRIIYRY
jgi:translation initiation factor IF-1